MFFQHNVLKYQENIIDKYEHLSPQIRELISNSIQMATVVICILIMHDDNTKKNDSNYLRFLHVFQMLGGTLLMANLMQNPINKFAKSLSHFLPLFINPNKEYSEHLRLENKFNQIQSALTVPQASHLKEVLKKMSFMVDLIGNNSDNLHVGFVTNIKEYLQYVFKLLEKNSVDDHYTIADKNRLLKKIDELIATYNQLTQKNLKVKVLKPFISNMYTDKKLPLAPICLIGGPSVGKTRFVEALAGITNSILIKYSASKYTSNHDYLYPTWVYHEEFKQTRVHFLTNALYQAKISGKKNIIFFFDELDKILPSAEPDVLPSLLTTLNSNLQQVDDIYLNLEIKLENIILIAAVNRKLSELSPAYIPLQDRFIEINFNNLTSELKTEITLNSVQIQFSELALEFTEKDKQQIIQLAVSDKNPGVRQLILQAKSYTANRNSDTILSGTIWENLKIPQDNEIAKSKFEALENHKLEKIKINLKRRNTI